MTAACRVSMESSTPGNPWRRAASRSRTGTTRPISVATSTDVAPGRVDSPPMSRIAAPARGSGPGARKKDFVTITTWRKLAEQASRYLDKGRLVAVEGRLQIRSYETQDGQRRKVAEVVADGIRFLDSGKRNGQRAEAVAEAQEQTAEAVPGEDDTREAPEAEEDVPF